MAQVRKAVITAAGRGTRHFPATRLFQKEMMPLVDRDGTTRPTIQIIVEEAVESGIEEVCIVVSPDHREQIRRHFRGFDAEQREAFAGKRWAEAEAEKLARLGDRVTFAVQDTPEGFGHAVHCARHFVGDEPFLLLLGDHVYISNEGRRCSRQLLDVFEREQVPVSAVQRTSEEAIHLYGTVAADLMAETPGTYSVRAIVEKPTMAEAEAGLQTAGLRRGEYLCFFGLYVLPPAIMDILGRHIGEERREQGEFQLTSALDELRESGPYLAAEINGSRHDMGVPFGYVQTQLALALHSPDRQKVMAALPSLLGQSDLETLR